MDLDPAPPPGPPGTPAAALRAAAGRLAVLADDAARALDAVERRAGAAPWAGPGREAFAAALRARRADLDVAAALLRDAADRLRARAALGEPGPGAGR